MSVGIFVEEMQSVWDELEDDDSIGDGAFDLAIHELVQEYASAAAKQQPNRVEYYCYEDRLNVDA